MFWAARAASLAVSPKVFSRAATVELREIAVPSATLIRETPIVAIATIIIIFV